MRKLYIFSSAATLVIAILLTILFVSADSPTTPFEYTTGDDDDANLTSSIQVPDGYNGDFSEFNIIQKSSAEALALTYTTGGSVAESELEAENGNVFWEVEVKFEGNEFDIVLDAGTGEVLGAFYEDEMFDFEFWIFDDD